MKETLPSALLTGTRTVVTAAHLEEEMRGYQKVYVDEESDYAVYVEDAYCPIISPKVGKTVYFCGTSGKVTSVSDTTFSVKVENTSMIVPGVSGSLVAYNDIYIGYVSGWDGEGHLKCIFY